MVLDMQHTHFGSATHIAATFLGILTAGTIWRLSAAHGLKSRFAFIRGLSRAAFVQY